MTVVFSLLSFLPQSKKEQRQNLFFFLFSFSSIIAEAPLNHKQKQQRQDIYNTKKIFLILSKKSYTYPIYIIIGCALFFLPTLVY